jgi:hypothetical protein
MDEPVFTLVGVFKMRYYINTRSDNLILFKIDVPDMEPYDYLVLMYDIIPCSWFVFTAASKTKINIPKIQKKVRLQLATLNLSIKTSLELFIVGIRKKFSHK